jgi:glycosyltransferase involved in cell wall biosynthesis
MNTHDRNVLVIAGEYPPLKTIGRIRTAKFVEHLRHLGWNPIVLTVEVRSNSTNYDPALESEIPEGVEVHRANWPDWETNVINKIKRLLGRGSNPRLPSIMGKSASGEGDTSTMPEQSTPSLFDKPTLALKWLFRHWIYIPDDYLPWSKCAYTLANEICDRNKIDIIFTSLPPFSAALIGHKLKKERGIPWVMDYRDLWEGDVLREWISPLRARIELRLERKLVKAADVVISVSEQKTEYLKKLHTKANPRWETLTNGYDTDIFEPLLAEPRIKNDTIDFVYTGRLFKNRRGYAFAEALGQIKQQNPELANNVRVHMYGGVSPEIQQRYNAILTQYDIADLYIFHGDVKYYDAMRAQVQCDYLLLIVDTGATSDGVIPGKLFEYIASQRPIFALCNPGATKDIIEKANAGIVLPAEAVNVIKTELEKWLRQSIPEKVSFDDGYLSQFERKGISARLARILSEISRLPT